MRTENGAAGPEDGGSREPDAELVGEGSLDRWQRVALLILIAVPLIPVGYGVGSLILETLRELLL